MTPEYNKYFKVIGYVALGFVVGFLLLNLAGRFFIEEITQNLFIENEEQKSTVIESGKKAPYFELQNVKGKLIKLTDYKDTAKVLVFWNTWGENSQNQFRIIDELVKKGDLTFKILTVNSQEERKVVSGFVSRGLYSAPEVLLDINGSVSDLYEARNMPALYFIDKEGVLRDIFFGVMTGEEIVDKISNYIK